MIAALLLAAALLAPLASPVAISVATPAHAPQMAVRGLDVALTFGAGSAIYFSASHDSGRTFAAPVRVAEVATLMLSRHRGPRIAFSRDAIVISAPASRDAATKPDLLVWRSTDHGATWTAAGPINDQPTAAEEGLHAMASDAAGNLFAAWLDDRSTRKQLYGSRSTDGGAHWSKNTLIYASPDGAICSCCHPSLAFDEHGEMLVMFRNALAGNRDMYIARSHDGATFSKPEKLGVGSWELNACPMDGGGIAASGDRVTTVWRRDREIYIAKPGEKETSLGEGMDVSIGGGYVAWSSARGIEFLRIGEKSPEVIATAGKYPDVVSVNQRALVAWEADGKILVDAR